MSVLPPFNCIWNLSKHSPQTLSSLKKIYCFYAIQMLSSMQCLSGVPHAIMGSLYPILYGFRFLPLWGWNTHWRNSIPNGHSQWAFEMILLPYLVKIAINGTMHHVRCLATWPRNARHVLRHAQCIWSFPDYLLFIYLWDMSEIGSWTCVLEYDISYTTGQNFHLGTSLFSSTRVQEPLYHTYIYTMVQVWHTPLA